MTETAIDAFEVELISEHRGCTFMKRLTEDQLLTKIETANFARMKTFLGAGNNTLRSSACTVLPIRCHSARTRNLALVLHTSFTSRASAGCEVEDRTTGTSGEQASVMRNPPVTCVLVPGIFRKKPNCVKYPASQPGWSLVH